MVYIRSPRDDMQHLKKEVLENDEEDNDEEEKEEED